MKHWPTALSSALLFIGGSARAAVADGLDPLAVALLAAALICLGVWLKEDS